MKELNTQLKNFQHQMATLGDQFKNVFQTVTKESKLGLDKRGIETNGANKSKEMDLREKLQDVSKQLNNLREKVDSLKNSLGGNSDDDFDLDRREVKSSSNDANSPECIEKSIVQESDPFILNIALIIMKRINAKENRLYIEELVNATADHLVVKMGATDGVKKFHKRLLNAVLQLLKVRSILTIKTEGEFIDKLESRKSRTLEPVDMNVDQIKVVKALEELLEGPMIKGFVSKVEEEKMINSAVKSLGDVLGLSKNKTKSLVQRMISRVKENEKASEHGKNQVKPMTDDEKIKGLEKLVVEKVKENKLNVKEVKYLVKGLSAAVGARNNLPASQTKKLENQILKGVQDYFAKIKLSGGVKKNKAEVKQDKDILKKLEELDELVGFRPAQSKNDVEKLEAHKKTKESADEKLKRQLKNLNKLASNLLDSKSLPGLSGGDTGDQVTIDAATNTYGTTKIVEQHNIRPEQVQTSKNVQTKSEDATNNGTNFAALLDELEKLITTIKASVSSSKTTRDRIFVDAAKGTIGETKVDESFKKKRGLSEIISDAISLIKSLQGKQPNSGKTEATTKALQTTVPTKTLKPSVEPKKATPSKDVEGKAKKSEISDLMTAEIEKAEARIQKELEDLQKSEEKNIKLLQHEKKEKNAEGNEKEEKQNEKEEKQNEKEEKQNEKEEKQNEKEEKQNEKEEKQKEKEEKQKEKEEKQKENEKKHEEQKEETVNERKKESEGKIKDNENLEQKPRQQKNHSNQTKIVVDEKEIEKELEAETNGKENLIDKLQRVDASSMKKRGLSEIIAAAISLIKSLKGKQPNSRKTEATTKALQTTVPTKTLKPSVERKKVTPSKDVEGKANKSAISDVIKVEVEKAEADIQKELEDLQKSEEKNIKLLEEDKKNAEKKENEEKQKEKEEKQKEKEKKEEEDEKQKENEEAEREKQKQKEKAEKEKHEQKEDRVKEKKKENEHLQQKARTQKSHGNQTKKNDIPGESKSQIMDDEKEIEKELEAQTYGKEKLIDKLQSLQAKPKMENSKETNKEGNNELIKELNELFAKN